MADFRVRHIQELWADGATESFSYENEVVWTGDKMIDEFDLGILSITAYPSDRAKIYGEDFARRGELLVQRRVFSIGRISIFRTLERHQLHLKYNDTFM